MKNVHVVDEELAEPAIIASFDTVAQAEDYIAELPDLDKVERGGYGIDAPENKIN